MHRCTVSCRLDADSKLPWLSRSSVDAPRVISRRSTRCRTTILGSMAVDRIDDGLWPLAPGDTTSMFESGWFWCALHGGFKVKEGSELLWAIPWWQWEVSLFERIQQSYVD